MTPNELMYRLEDFVAKWDGPPLVFAKVWGSHSHNCATEASDLDFLAVYRESTETILGLDPIRETIERKVADGSPYDLEAHELGKFCRLLLKGGPAMLEILFTDRMRLVKDPAFDRLVLNRDRFLCGRAVKQYLGYAEGQIKRLNAGQSLHSRGGEATEKWAYHFTRLINDALRISSGEGPTVWKDGEERELLMKVRRGEVSAAKVVADAESAIGVIRSAESKWKVPPEPPTSFVQDWLIRQRLVGWEGVGT